MLFCEIDDGRMPRLFRQRKLVPAGRITLASLSLFLSHLALRAWPGTAPHHLPNPDTIQHHAAIHFVMRGFKCRCLKGGCDHIIFHLIHFFPERFDGFALGDVQWLNISLLIPRRKCAKCRSTSWHVLAGLAVSSDLKKKKNLETASLDCWSVDLNDIRRHLYGGVEFMMRDVLKCSLRKVITFPTKWTSESNDQEDTISTLI